MTSAMRYALFGFLCASIAGLFMPPWYVVVISYALGMILGFVLGLTLAAWERVLDRVSAWWDSR